MSKRSIVKIDEDKCNGCGLCAPACAEGAIQIVDGKARLVKETYCDGLGACLGHCPQGAITIEEREADSFDEEEVKEHLAHLEAHGQSAAQPGAQPALAHTSTTPQSAPGQWLGTNAHAFPQPPAAVHARSDCPGSRAQMFARPAEALSNVMPAPPEACASASAPSELTQWPVQLKLVPPAAPCFQDADLLLAADCAPFAYADFHRRLLRGKALAIGCPKLDDASYYVEKLAGILSASTIRSLTVVRMEVPCCGGLMRIAQAAIVKSGKAIPLNEIIIGIQGDILAD
ncbi:MAG: 4Fe-4S binding protein [Candidatus Sumerlaeota bacterium]|nr:4Fe-4S binding protein [Candidatus Sumerlaeota bacterium]